ncbi:MAG: tRNA-uridine aminocarboxypropyltransferase [Bacteriovorax sp.]
MNKRPLCPRCHFIIARCLCDALSPIFNQTELIVLQHPSEAKHALNTVRLMKNAFQKISIFIGENFDEHIELKNVLAKNSTALIFPKPQAKALENGPEEKITHLILIDGSWNKAKKIFCSSICLQTLPTYSLSPQIKSQYRIRSSKFEDGLSTLEASTHALKILEPELSTQSLEKAFIKMIDFQIEKMGKDVFEKNYLKPKKVER